MRNTKNVLRFIIIFQYLPRLFLIFPLSQQIINATGVVTETAWAGAAYNLVLFMLASHVSIKKFILIELLSERRIRFQRMLMSVTYYGC